MIKCDLDQKLIRKIIIDGKEHWAEVIFDKDKRRKIFVEEHGSNLGGHSGKTKTIAKIREQYYWPGVCQQMEIWVNNNL